MDDQFRITAKVVKVPNGVKILELNQYRGGNLIGTVGIAREDMDKIIDYYKKYMSVDDNPSSNS